MAADDFAAAMTVISHPELIRQGILNYREYVKENEIKVAENKPLTKGQGRTHPHHPCGMGLSGGEIQF